jgi:predicted permease
MKMLGRLARAPGFAFIVVLTIGLVVGVDATIFTALNAVVLRDLPVPGADRLVRIAAVLPRGETREELPYADFVSLRDASERVQTAAFSSMRSSVTHARETRSLGIETVSGNFFEVLGAPLGRGTSEVVISRELERLWFAGNALGRPLVVQGRTHTITGIAGARFRGTNLAAPADVWLPLEGTGNVRLIGRLGDGVSLAEAQAALTAALPDRNRIARVRVGSERAMLISPEAPRAVSVALSIALGLVALSALVAAANVVGILFARVAMRRRDLGIRVALGATPGTLMREIVAETMPLAIPSALVAWLVAAYGSRVYMARMPMHNRPAFDFSPDARVALFVTLLSAAAVFFAAVAAAIYARGTVPNNLAARGGSPRTPGVLRWIVAGQLALSVVVLITAGLLVQTARAYRNVDPGFEYDRQLVVRLQGVPLPHMRELADRLRALPGVTHVSIARNTPMGRQTPMTFRGTDGEPIEAYATYIDGDYFASLGIPLLRGPGFVPHEKADVAIVNETMAKRRPALSVVAVARDARYGGLAEASRPYVYLPIERAPVLEVAHLQIRTDGETAGGARDVNAVLVRAGIDATATTLADSVQTDRWLAETASIVAGALGVLTLLIAAIGLFGVISTSVTNRSRELAIRAAHGATRGDLGALVAASSGRLLLVGAAAGALLSIPAASALASLLFGVNAFDAATWTAVALVILATVIAATVMPALRAMQVNANELLREV